MINQKDSKQVRMDSWLLKVLSRVMEPKTKTKINQQTITKASRHIKNNRKIKGMGNITPVFEHCPGNGQMGDTDL